MMMDMDCINWKSSKVVLLLFRILLMTPWWWNEVKPQISSIKTKDFYLTFSLYTFYYNKTLLCLYIAPLNLKMATAVWECKLGRTNSDAYQYTYMCVYQGFSNNLRYLGIVRSIIQSLSISKNTHCYSFFTWYWYI